MAVDGQEYRLAEGSTDALVETVEVAKLEALAPLTAQRPDLPTLSKLTKLDSIEGSASDAGTLTRLPEGVTLDPNPDMSQPLRAPSTCTRCMPAVRSLNPRPPGTLSSLAPMFCTFIPRG